MSGTDSKASPSGRWRGNPTSGPIAVMDIGLAAIINYAKTMNVVADDQNSHCRFIITSLASATVVEVN